MTAWITLIGMGDDGLDGLAPHLTKRIHKADLIIGSKRLLAFLPDIQAAEKQPWPSPFDPMAERLRAAKGKNIIVLASGDPLWYGVGATLLKHFPPEDLEIHPHPSAFALAAAQLGWAMQDIVPVSLHAHPIETLNRHIHPRARLVVITSGAHSVAEITALLVARGFGDSIITVLEHMGGAWEKRHTLQAAEFADQSFASFNTLAIDCIAGKDADIQSTIPGLPDEAFAHDGQLTKREVRAATLAALSPLPGQHLWDIGAGAGSIAIEWLRSAKGMRATAFEQDAARCAFISENADRLGVPEIEIINAGAPACLAQASPPDAVFWGGGVADKSIFTAARHALLDGGRLVANAVTLESQQMLMTLHEQYGGELVRIAIERLNTIGPHPSMRPLAPVLQWRIVKGKQ